jgi:hypothetical protein
MLLNTRRRMLGLLAATAGLPLLPSFRAIARTPECFASQAFGPWTGIATHTQAGAKINQVTFLEPAKCDLRAEIQIAANLEGKLVVYGDPDKTRLPKTFLVHPDNRLMVRTENGSTAIDEQLCGVCTDIHDDKVSIVLPLACVPLLRSERNLEIAIKLGDTEECRFKLNCETLRKALEWATDIRDQLAERYAEQQCTPPQGCFITTACCDMLGLADDCFELRALRRYRDLVLARTPGGAANIALYYTLAPAILCALREPERSMRLARLYARFILPSAIAATLGLNRLAYRLYASMMLQLAAETRLRPR